MLLYQWVAQLIDPLRPDPPSVQPPTSALVEQEPLSWEEYVDHRADKYSAQRASVIA